MRPRFNVAKTMFFDRAAVKALAGAAHKVLSRWGAYVRRRSRSSLRPARQKTAAEMTADETRLYQIRVEIAKRKGETKPRRPEVISRPGEVPKLHRSRTRTAARSPLKTAIEFAFNTREVSTVVGPEATAETRGDATQSLEHGGTSLVVARGQRRAVRIAARPFMQPAAEAERPNLLRWRNTVR